MFSGLSAAHPSTRRWTALASLTLQGAVVAAVLIFPMLYPQDLPQVLLSRRIFVPASRGQVQADTKPTSGPSGGPQRPNVLVVSTHAISITEAPPPSSDSGPAPVFPGPYSGPGPELSPPLSMAPVILPHPPTPAQSFRASVVMAGNLIRRVEPQYPVIARQIRLEGCVVLKATISREGNIEQVEVASGPSLLVKAARDAVQQWKYRPYLLNGQPVEVETEITVNFVLER